MSSDTGSKNKKEAKFIATKCCIVLSLLLQGFRIFGTGVIFYNEIEIIILKVRRLSGFTLERYSCINKKFWSFDSFKFVVVAEIFEKMSKMKLLSVF